MAGSRTETNSQPPAKRHKGPSTSEDEMRANPYLQHMIDNRDDSDYGHKHEKTHNNDYYGYSNASGNSYEIGNSKSTLTSFTRHQTTAKQAYKAEDGPDNPFTGGPLSQKYFDILETRRNLPVHKQRYISFDLQHLMYM